MLHEPVYQDHLRFQRLKAVSDGTAYAEKLLEMAIRQGTIRKLTLATAQPA